MFEDLFCIPNDKAPKIVSITFEISAACSPFFGIGIDKVGKRVYFLVLGQLLNLLTIVLQLIIPASCPDTSYKILASVIVGGIGTALCYMLAITLLVYSLKP